MPDLPYCRGYNGTWNREARLYGCTSWDDTSLQEGMRSTQSGWGDDPATAAAKESCLGSDDEPMSTARQSALSYYNRLAREYEEVKSYAFTSNARPGVRQNVICIQNMPQICTDFLDARANGKIRMNDRGYLSVVDAIGNVFTNTSTKVTRQSCLKTFRRCCSDVAVEMYQFDGQGQRSTPVASPKTIRQILSRIVARSRLSSKGKRKLFDEHKLPLDSSNTQRVFCESETISAMQTAFAHCVSETQFKVGVYRVDLYFACQRIAVECDKFGYRSYNSEQERKRSLFIAHALQCRFFRFDPQSSGF